MPKRPPTHKPPSARDRNPVHGQQVQTHGRISGRRWMAIRKQFFSRHPLCEACKREGVVKEATFLDHIVPLYAGGKNEWSNYQGLCKAHSFAKTGRENSARLKGQPAPVEPEPDREPWQPVIA